MPSFIEFQLELAELPCIDGVYTMSHRHLWSQTNDIYESSLLYVL